MRCRAPGPLQRVLLAALRRHGREATLSSLAALAAGLIQDLGARLPLDRAPSRAQYVSVARAVSTLKRRGLVETRLIGVARGRPGWLVFPDGRRLRKWRFEHPTAILRVWAESSGVTDKNNGNEL